MALELWGGVECSHVQLHDRTVDQLELTGHDLRRSDMNLLAELGVAAVRYPVILGRIAPDGLKNADWRWPDERLAFLRKAGIRPVATLLHHGTRHLHLDVRHPAFPAAVAEYAGAVARRYPWLQDYTPVNEPLTTARFSCLYGPWYPHAASDADFYRAIVNLCRATALSMRAIRNVNPHARLVHTEDLGWSHSTPALHYQADFENERRWLGLDLLCGRVDNSHEFHAVLLEAGVAHSELDWFLENPCPPDVLGCDYYPTSERVLDERLEQYPDWSHGGNGHMSYADVHVGMAEEFRARGLEQLLFEAWERLGLPLALTEVHVDAPPHEQVHWLNSAWDTAGRLTTSNVEVVAVCAWALFGVYDWDSLMTRDAGYYEAGAFDLSSGRPVATKLAAQIRRLNATASSPTLT